MICREPSLHVRLKQRDMRVTLDGICMLPFGCFSVGLANPLSLSIQVPSQQTMRRFFVCAAVRGVGMPPLVEAYPALIMGGDGRGEDV